MSKLDSSAIIIVGLIVSLSEITTSDIFSLSSSFKTLIKSFILLLFLSFIFVLSLFVLLSNFERSTFPFVIYLNVLSLYFPI